MPSIGACLIVKNESALLPRCLESLKGIDEIFISDTGSSDNTVEVARKYTNNVWTEDLWHDSFADARNFIKQKATTDWILSIDADEILHDYSKVVEAVAVAEQKGLFAVDCTLIAENNSGDARGTTMEFPRLFKNTSQVWWVGNIHNHLSLTGEKVGDVKITFGYSPAHDLDPDRTIRILKHDVETLPSPIRETFYLGREYYYKRDYETALKHLGNYVQKSAFPAEKAEAFFIMAKCYGYLGSLDDSRDAVLQAIGINPNFKEALQHMAWVAGDGKGNPRTQRQADRWNSFAELANNDDVLFIRYV